MATRVRPELGWDSQPGGISDGDVVRRQPASEASPLAFDQHSTEPWGLSEEA